jgi:hypothetical protein
VRIREHIIMASSLSRSLLVLVALGASVVASAADLETVVLAMEAPAQSVTLPASETGPAVLPSCGGCPPKSFPTTATTAYYQGRQRITLAELRALAIRNPDVALTVSYTVKTGELVSITIDLPRKKPR